MDKYCELYVDSARGIYIPQYFAESHDPDKWDFSGCYPDSLDILLQGPDHESYWDSWQDVLDYAETKDGWTLYQDGDLWVVNLQGAIDAVNESCESYLEYEESHIDAGNNYAHMVAESWDDQKTRDVMQQINNPPETYLGINTKIDSRGYPVWEPNWTIDTMGLDPDEIADICLDIFEMVDGYWQSQPTDSIVLDSFAVGEVEVDIQSLGIPPIVLDLIRDSCDACLSKFGEYAYMSTDAVWYAVVDPKDLQKAIKEKVESDA